MKKVLIILITLLIILSIALLYIQKRVQVNSRKHEVYLSTLQHTASESVVIFEDLIPFENSEEKRTLAIYLPADYKADTTTYPVFYFLDGQSIFDEKILIGDEWQVDEILDSLADIDIKAIAVGIYNSDKRDSEYQPNFSLENQSKMFTGNEHSEWIVNTVKPWVDDKFRTKSEASSTIIGGASLGGLMSYYMLTEYSDVFGGAIIMSPSFWVDEKSTTLDNKVENMNKKLIYLSAGGKERGIINGVKHLNKVLLERGLQENFRFEIEEDEIHRNLAWRKMVRKSIPWMLGRMKGQSRLK